MPGSGAAAGFHATVPGYRPTPLVEVAALAGALGVGRVFVKDESSRLGLPAFKVLGASWAVCRVLAARAGVGAVASWAGLRELAGGLAGVRLVTATDGNHGRAVARVARLLGLEAHVLLPEAAGATAAAAVHHRGGRAGPPAALLGVEPAAAACVLASLTGGRLASVATGVTVMAGLNCPTPSSVAWPYLRDGLDAAVAVSDAAARRAVGELAGLGIAAGPSGAASLAGARAALTGAGVAERRAALGLHGDSTVVLLSTEGPSTSNGDEAVAS